LLVVCALCLVHLGASQSKLPDEDWGYANVRPNAYLFWWFYGMADPAKRDTAPVVVWLQGGPGASSTGFGNFEEIGPLDINLNPRPINWVQSANILFVDSPVGAGFSYVTSPGAYVQKDQQIGVDLVGMLQSFLAQHPSVTLNQNPFWIFCESYGGKETLSFGVALAEAIKKGEIKINFKGVALGDSWISPGDFLASYSEYLYGISEVDNKGKALIDTSANAALAAIQAQQWLKATQIWSDNQNDIENATFGINVYNVLDRSQDQQERKGGLTLKQRVRKILEAYEGDPLTDLMNGKIREKLKIIPANVTWSQESDDVFNNLAMDFMKPAIAWADSLISQNYNVVVYSGNLDLICCTTGTLKWMKQLSWSQYPTFDAQPRTPIMDNNGNIVAFRKQYLNFQFFTILSAGHMVPSDQPYAAKSMLDLVINGQ